MGWLTAPALPLWALASSANPRWRSDWRERWGLGGPPVQPGAIWIVASSLGEVRAAAGLIEALGEVPTLLTADTDTGAELARSLVPVAGRKPVDHPFTLAPLWAEARPSALVWVEGAWWPALGALARRDRVPACRVNARPGNGTARRIALGLEAPAVIARDLAAASWFRERGVEPVDWCDLKASAPAPQGSLAWDGDFGVAGSVHRSDLPHVRALHGARPDWSWLVAPRHLEEIPWWRAQLGASVLRSELPPGRIPAGTLVLLDSLGELAGLYAGARVAWVGGTADPEIGGHSPHEAWRAGVPTLAGPHGEAQGDTWTRAGTTRVWGPEEVGPILAHDLAAPPPADEGSVNSVAARVRALRGPTAPESSPRPWARPLAGTHRRLRRAWHLLYDRGLRDVVRIEVPVVSVGSANARGPGKTATVRWLLGALQRRGWTPGVATRGHGRVRSGTVGSWEDDSAAGLGDEGATLARAGWPVAADRDRVAAARTLVARGVDVVVLDDGLQHRRLHRDLDLVVVDGRFPTGRGELPMGEAREEAVPERAHGVVLHHGVVAGGWSQPTAVALRHPGPWHRGSECMPEGPRGPVAAFAGIGRPADFLAGLGLEVARFRALADHQPLDGERAAELLGWADGLPLVCTDKDHVRLPPWVARQVWWRTVSLEITGVPDSWFSRLEAV